jgi:hypothetical protein
MENVPLKKSKKSSAQVLRMVCIATRLKIKILNNKHNSFHLVIEKQ